MIPKSCRLFGQDHASKRSWQLGSAAKHALQEALLWSSIALAGFGLFYFYDDLIAALRLQPEIAAVIPAPQQNRDAKIAMSDFGGEVRVRADRQGHFIVDAAINGRPVTLMADTGATLVVLSFEDAEKLGLSPRSLDFTGLAQTANGVSRIAPVTLDRVRVDRHHALRHSSGGCGARRALREFARHELLGQIVALRNEGRRAGAGAITRSPL